MRPPSIAIVALAVIASHATAQVRFETGGGAARVDQMSPSSLTSLGGSADMHLGIARFHFNGAADDHIGLGVAGQLNSVLHAGYEVSGWRVEAGPSMQAARDIGAQWARSVAADVNVEHDVGRLTLRGAWQSGLGRTGAGPISWYRPTLAAELRAGNLTFGATWQSVVARDSVLSQNFFTDTLGSSQPRDSNYRSRIRDVRDVGFTARWAAGPLSFSGHLTQRFGTGVAAQMWWEGLASMRLTPIMSLTVKSGRLASDVVLGQRGGNYTTVGVRVDILQRAPLRERTNRAALAVVERDGPDRVRLRFTLSSDVRQATIASDLTEWRTTILTRTDDGRWEVVLPAKPGIHRVNIRTDDGPWRAPPGLPTTDDGFGTLAGLLVLEP